MNYREQRREEYYIQGGVRGKHRYVIKIGSTNRRNRIIHGVGARRKIQCSCRYKSNIGMDKSLKELYSASGKTFI